MGPGRLALALVAAWVVLGAAVADPHPGHPQPTVAIANFAFTPQTINAYTGDTVLWNWNGPDTNHSVTSDASSAKQFDSDAGKSPATILHPTGDVYAVTFDKAGTYTYHCRVHSNMTGTVVVKVPPSTTPAAPKLSAVSARVKGRIARVTLTVDQRSDVQLLVTRRGAKHALREVDSTVPKGTSTRKVGFGRLKPGAYDLRTIAVNPATGLSSRTIVVHVRLGR